MKEKYIEEKFPRYFIFGESEDGKFVDVDDPDGDIVTHVERQEAERLIRDRNKIVDALIKAIQKLGYEYWKNKVTL